jgi:outer membrane immunogenic protein
VLRYLQSIPACATLVLALGSPAFATDLPAPVYKAPVYKAPAAAPLYNWSGFYIGVNAGYGWGKANTDIAYAGGNALEGPVGNSFDPLPAFAHSDSGKLNGPNGGGQIGYNWQFAPMGVLGIEADLQATRQKHSNRFVDSFSSSFNDSEEIVTDDLTHVTDFEAKISWFGTVRGRLGYAWNGVLLYGTGGLAYGEVGLSGTSVSTLTGSGGDNIDVNPFTIVTAKSFAASAVNLGWTAGAGIEGALANNWTWKAEYLHMDLGSLSVTGIAATGATFTASSKFTDEIVRVGLNYRFAPASAVAPY